MVKPEWGTKRTCPKCATRFYDLGKDDPVTCIDPDCGNSWMPEPVLKSKQPMPFEVAVAAPEKPEPSPPRSWCPTRMRSRAPTTKSTWRPARTTWASPKGTKTTNIDFVI